MIALQNFLRKKHWCIPLRPYYDHEFKFVQGYYPHLLIVRVEETAIFTAVKTNKIARANSRAGREYFPDMYIHSCTKRNSTTQWETWIMKSDFISAIAYWVYITVFHNNTDF